MEKSHITKYENNDKIINNSYIRLKTIQFDVYNVLQGRIQDFSRGWRRPLEIWTNLTLADVLSILKSP